MKRGPAARVCTVAILLSATLLAGCVTEEGVQIPADGVPSPVWENGQSWSWQVSSTVSTVSTGDSGEHSGTRQQTGELTQTVVETELPFGDVPVRWVRTDGASPEFGIVNPMYGWTELVAVDKDLDAVAGARYAHRGSYGPMYGYEAAEMSSDGVVRTVSVSPGPPESVEEDADCRLIDAFSMNHERVQTGLLRFPLTQGASWDATMNGPGDDLAFAVEVMGLEVVETAAGPFEAVRLVGTGSSTAEDADPDGPEASVTPTSSPSRFREEIKEYTVDLVYWYAPGVGQIVRSEEHVFASFVESYDGETRSYSITADVTLDLQNQTTVVEDVGLGGIGSLRDNGYGGHIMPMHRDVRRMEVNEVNLFDDDTLEVSAEDVLGKHLHSGRSIDEASSFTWSLRTPDRGGTREFTGRTISIELEGGGTFWLDVRAFGKPELVTSRCADRVQDVALGRAAQSVYAYWEADLEVAFETGDAAGDHALANVPLSPGAQLMADFTADHQLSTGPQDEVVLQATLEGHTEELSEGSSWAGDAGDAVVEWNAQGPQGTPVLLGHKAKINVRVDYWR